MALGAVTIQPVMVGGVSSDPGDLRVGNGLKLVVVNVVGDSSYPTGGSAITPTQLGLANGIVALLSVNLAASSGANNAADRATLVLTNSGTTINLKCFSLTDAVGVPIAETANATNLSGLTWQIVALGW